MISLCGLKCHARVMLINPLHKNLPHLALMIMPTCNRFSHLDVRRQWEEIRVAYEECLQDVLGPVIGNSSDGDSGRRKLMMAAMSSNEGDRFLPIPEELGFVLTAKIHEQPNGGYRISGLGDQEYIHEHKKLINPLDHPSRIMMMGENHLIHRNHLK